MKEFLAEELPYRIGVHVAHCCKDHGCKYGDAQCSVYAGDAAQGYPCEECDEPEITITKLEYDRLKNDSRFLAALEAYGVDNWEGWDACVQAFARGNV